MMYLTCVEIKFTIIIIINKYYKIRNISIILVLHFFSWSSALNMGPIVTTAHPLLRLIVNVEKIIQANVKLLKYLKVFRFIVLHIAWSEPQLEYSFSGVLIQWSIHLVKLETVWVWRKKKKIYLDCSAFAMVFLRANHAGATVLLIWHFQITASRLILPYDLWIMEQKVLISYKIT